MAGTPRMVVVQGFGPADWISRLKKAKWSACMPGMPMLKTFDIMSLAGTHLNDRGDIFSSCGIFVVTVENLSTGRSFQVHGHAYSDIVLKLKTDPQVRIDGDFLRGNPVRHYCRFRVTVERIK